MKNLFYRMMAPFDFRHGQNQLHRLESKLISRRQRFAVPFVYQGKRYFKSIEPRQNPVEIESLYACVCQLCPERVLEIGTARGGTLYLWAQASTVNAHIVSIDLPGGRFGGAYPSCRTPFYTNFARTGQRIQLLREDSHQLQTVERVKGLFGYHPVDFVFIDGDHTYDGVKADFFNYGPLVRPGGLIAFHDILPRPDQPEIQVALFWKEIREQYQAEEMVAPDGSGRKIGIGLIYARSS